MFRQYVRHLCQSLLSGVPMHTLRPSSKPAVQQRPAVDWRPRGFFRRPPTSYLRLPSLQRQLMWRWRTRPLALAIDASTQASATSSIAFAGLAARMERRRGKRRMRDDERSLGVDWWLMRDPLVARVDQLAPLCLWCNLRRLGRHGVRGLLSLVV